MNKIKYLGNFIDYHPLCPLCGKQMAYDIYNLDKCFCQVLPGRLFIKFKEGRSLPVDIELEIDIHSNLLKLKSLQKPQYKNYYPVEIEKRCPMNHSYISANLHINFDKEEISIINNEIDEKCLYLVDLNENKHYVIREMTQIDMVSIDMVSITVDSYSDVPGYKAQTISLNRFDIYSLIRTNEEETINNISRYLNIL